MRRVAECSRPRAWARVACLGLIAASVAGCSSESSRLSDNVFANPFASKNTRGSAEATGSVPAAQSAPVGRVESQPLQYSTQSLPPPPNAGRPATVASSGQAGGGRGMASYTPASVPVSAPPAAAVSAPDITGSTVQPLPPPPSKRPAAQTGWNWDGGSAVIVGPGENLDGLSRKYGVPGQAILQANGFGSASAIQPGQRIVIPRYNYSQASASQTSAPQAARAPHPAAAPIVPATGAGGAVHVVAPGETLISIARHYHKPLTEVAAANRIAPHTLVKIGDRIVIPGPATATAKPAPAAIARAQPPARAQVPAAAPQTASAERPATVRVATPAAEANGDDDAAPVGTSGGAPQFRWPVRGRVITGFGAKPNGQQNDGINLAVPEGTAVRAAEDGVVAYAGNELKGYGNLILVRHSNGFVTAYAHASEIMVKRNDPVRRGQVIAKSGQSGTVTTPQLHFEIRKGSAPVDPSQYLPAG